MKKFYDREEEIRAFAEIEKKSKKNGRFTCVLGPRRIGKTALVTKVFPSSLYFFVERKTEEAIITEFSGVLKQRFEFVPDFSSFSSLLEHIFNEALKKQITVIFDEFQNFAFVDKSIFSTFQKLWDKYKTRSKINLIAVGSLYSSMEKIFADSHEPLFGRNTGRFNISSFKISVIWKILKDHKEAKLSKLIEIYAIFGGVPKYYDLLEENDLFKQPTGAIFEKLFLKKDAILKDEGKNILIEEFGSDYQTYFSVCQAVAATPDASNQKIGSLAGLELNHVSTYLKNLEEKFSVIFKENSMVNLKRKGGRYALKDPLMRNWFKFIFGYRSLIESGQNKEVLKIFQKELPNMKGRIFEEIVLKIFESDFKLFPYLSWGRFWDKTCEIDIVGLNRQEKTAILIECKMNAKEINDKFIDEFKNKEKHLLTMLEGYKIRKCSATASIYTGKKYGGVEIFDERDLVKMLEKRQK